MRLLESLDCRADRKARHGHQGRQNQQGAYRELKSLHSLILSQRHEGGRIGGMEENHRKPPETHDRLIGIKRPNYEVTILVVVGILAFTVGMYACLLVLGWAMLELIAFHALRGGT